MKTRATLFTLLALATVSASAQDRAPVGSMGAGSLGNLHQPKTGKLVHYSSSDPKGENDDRRAIAPGETLTLMDHQGAGTVRRFWMTIAPFNFADLQRQTIVRCYWDGEKEPSVEVPISDFFGMGFGEWNPYQSLPLNMTSGGFNCYWPMPFRKSARITIENRSPFRIDSYYYNLDVETAKSLPKDTRLFHAQFRRATSEAGKPLTLLETTGKGHYVGTLLSMQPRQGRNLRFLEGDEFVWVDGEEKPSVAGTGTEDYFSSGWYYNTGTYAAPYHGVTIRDADRGRINTYRWHIEDPIPFRKSLKFQIEHGDHNTSPGVDYTSVAYWYQTHPRPAFPPLPKDLLPLRTPPFPKIAGLVEGEDIVNVARATSGAFSEQEMRDFTGMWSRFGQLWWQPEKPGERLSFLLDAPDGQGYDLVGYFTQAPDYGDIRVRVNGQELTPVVGGYADKVRPTGPISLGRIPFRAGPNDVVLEVAGKDARSTGYKIGLDGLLLRP